MSVPWLGTRYAGVVTAIHPSPRSGKSTTTGASSSAGRPAAAAAAATSVPPAHGVGHVLRRASTVRVGLVSPHRDVRVEQHVAEHLAVERAPVEQVERRGEVGGQATDAACRALLVGQ